MMGKIGRFAVYFIAVFLILSIPINEKSLFGHVSYYTQTPITQTVQCVKSTMHGVWQQTRSFLIHILS